jgi:hypothetical protein
MGAVSPPQQDEGAGPQQLAAASAGTSASMSALTWSKS